MRATVLAGLAAVAIFGGLGSAAWPEEKKAPPNPVGASPGWSASVQGTEPAPGIALGDKEIQALRKVNGYFNGLSDMKGQFIQTTADSKRLRGKFYVKKPGRFRFDYALPSRLVIVSDGKYLAIQDHDLKTDDRIPLDSTPFRLLLRNDVDVMRDAQILELQEADDLIIVTMQDRNADIPGKIKLFLAKSPALELREWVTTDAQGLDTRVELSNLDRAEEVDPGLFKPTMMEMPKL